MENNKKYIISLDKNVDFDYLPLKTLFDANNFDTVPIWSVEDRNKNSGEFYEFELIAKEENASTSDCEEISLVEQCYICDTSVPTEFVQNHYTSEKHRICAAIIRHALRRATKHAQSIPFTHTGSATNSVPLSHASDDISYFCDHCSLAVKLKNKDAHEKTKEHQVSVIHDRLLNGLLITYLDKSKVVANSRYEDKASDTSEVSTKDDVNDNDDVSMKHVDGPDNTDDELYTDKDKQTEVGEVFKDGREEAAYVMLCEETTELCDAKRNSEDDHIDAVVCNEQDTVEIMTVQGLRYRVPANNYHGFVNTWAAWADDGNFNCLLCDRVVIDTVMHKEEPRHVELITKPVPDNNCIRQIDNVWHHCIICNQMLQDKKHHVATRLHKNNFRPLEFTRKHLKLQEKENKYYCDICYSEMPVKFKDGHLNGARHAAILLRRSYIAKNRVLHHHLKKFADTTLCIICKVVVHDDEIDTHVISNAHDLGYKKLLVANKMTKLRRDFYCYACNTKPMNVFEIDHIQSKMHVDKLSVYKPVPSLPLKTKSIEDIDFLDDATAQLLYLFESTVIPKKVRCIVCKVDIKSKSAQIKKHLNKPFHQFNHQALLDVNYLQIRLNGAYFCEVCRDTVDFTKEIDHVNSDHHERHMNDVPLSWRERDNNISSAAVSSAVSKRYVLDGNIEDNLDTKPTQNDIKTIEYANESFKPEEHFEQLAHLNRPKLIDSLQKYMSETDSDISENKLSVSKYTSSVPVNVNCVEDLDVTIHLLYLFESTDELKEIKCQVCKVKSTSAQIKKHLEKQIHQLNLEALLDINKIKNRIIETYFCETCIFDFSKKVDHIDNDNHEINMTNVRLSWRERDNDKSSAALSSADNPASKLHVSDFKIVENLSTKPTEIDATTNMYSNKTSKPRESLQFKQLLYINKLRSVDECEMLFCDLCTEHVASKSVIEHVQNKSHLDKLIENLNGEDKNIPQYYCEACQTYISDIYFIRDIHNRSTQHQLNIKSLRKQVNTEEHQIRAASSNFDYMFVPADKQSSIKCKVCQHVLKLRKIKRHLESSKHIKSLSSLCTENKLNLQFTGKYLCEFCNDNNVEVKEMLNHIASEKHIKNIFASNDTDSTHNLQSTTLGKSITESKITTAGKDKRNILESQPSNETKLSSCAKHNVTVHNINTQNSAASTINNKTTEKRAAKPLKNKVESSSVKLLSYKVNSFDKDTESLRASNAPINTDMKNVCNKDMTNYLIESPLRPFEVICKICDTIVPNTEINIQDHLKGRRHKSNYAKFVSEIVQQDVNNKLKTIYDKSCNTNATKTNTPDHTNKDIAKNATFLQDPVFKLLEGAVFCRCCNTEISSTKEDVNTHVTDWRHEIKLSAMLVENGLTVNKVKIYCNVCDIKLSKLSGITHIDSPSHKMKALDKSIDNNTGNN